MIQTYNLCSVWVPGAENTWEGREFVVVFSILFYFDCAVIFRGDTKVMDLEAMCSRCLQLNMDMPTSTVNFNFQKIIKKCWWTAMLLTYLDSQSHTGVLPATKGLVSTMTTTLSNVAWRVWVQFQAFPRGSILIKVDTDLTMMSILPQNCT